MTDGALTTNQSIFQPRPENLASLFQEVLTAVVRLRTDRQSVSDARQFRIQILEAIKLANNEARRLGYSQESLRSAIFAVVAFVDESVMNERMEIFEDWARKPLQEEMFGVALAGNVFFDNLERILMQTDSHEVADLLELHQLCLLLGYRGRYGSDSLGEVKGLTDAIADKVRRTRGASGELSPAWKLPTQEAIESQTNPWNRRLLLVFGGSLMLFLLLVVVFNLSLNSQLAELKGFASEPRK